MHKFSSIFLSFIAALLLAGGDDAVAVGKDITEPVVVSAVVIRGPDNSTGCKVGVCLQAKFAIADGWHIYGQTVGSVGLPTKVIVKAVTKDPTFTVNDFIWPQPAPFSQAGGPDSLGYTRELTLLAPITSDLSINDNSRMAKLLNYAVEVKASWLACNESLCVPGKHTQKLELLL